MNRFHLLTLGYQVEPTNKLNITGSLVPKLESFAQLLALAKGKSKEKQPGTFAFFGKRGEKFFCSDYNEESNEKRIAELVELYKSEHDCTGLKDYEIKGRALRHYNLNHIYGGSNVVQIDIDTQEFTDSIMANADRLNELCCNSLVLIQPSYHHKLHFIVHTRQIYDFEEYKREAAIVTVWVCKAIEDITGTNPFEILDDKDKCCVDNSSNNPAQSLFFSANEYVEFKDFDEFAITDEQRQKVAESAGLLFAKVFKDKIEYAVAKPFEGVYEITNPHKIRVNRNYNVDGYTGNAVRMQYANVVLWYCKGNREKFHEMSKRLFVNYWEFTPVGDFNPNPMFKSAFDREFGIITTECSKVHRPTDTDGILIPKAHWLTEYGDRIGQELDASQKIEVVAPTGTGKTVYITNYAKQHKTLIIVPFNTQLVNYRQEWINIVTTDKQSFNQNVSNVCVWDQVEKHVGCLDESWTVVIDEAHLLWSDRSWRESATTVIEQVNDCARCSKVMLFTATDTIERTLFGIDKVITFKGERDTVLCSWLDVDSPYRTMERLITTKKKTCIFSDRYAKTLAMNLKDDMSKAAVTYCHSESMDNKFQRVLDEQQLVSDVTVSTKILYSGNNLNNVEPVRLIVQIDKNHDHSYIIQAIGRFRHCKDLEVYIVNDLKNHSRQDGSTEQTIRDELQRLAHTNDSNIAKAMLSHADFETYYNVDVAAELEKYYAGIDKNYIIDQLCRTGYLQVKDCGKCGDEKEQQPENKVKRRRSNLLIGAIRDNSNNFFTIIKEDKDDDIDTAGWKRKLARITMNDVDADSVVGYINTRSEDSTVMLDAIIRELNTIVEMKNLTADEIGRIKAGYKKFAEEETVGCLTVTKERVIKYVRFMSHILDRIEITFPNRTVESMSIEDMFECATAMWSDDKIALRSRRSDTARRTIAASQPIAIRWIGSDILPDVDGIDKSQGVLSFTCKGDCMRFLGCSTRTYSKFLQGNSKLNKLWQVVS